MVAEAYPSNHIDSFRALENPKFLLIDECDCFRKLEQDDFRFVSERYIGKSDPYIVLVCIFLLDLTNISFLFYATPKSTSYY
jgi:hypothetical protein